jgi:O-acetyl-ADP-ribose deacetylase (regulator of RNase III)
LANCYRHALECARDHDLESVAFPAISTGIYGFPPDRAAPIAVATVAAVLEEEPELSVIFCCFNEDSAMLHLKALQAL